MNVIDFQRDRFRMQLPTIPDIAPYPAPSLRLKVQPGLQSRALHFGVAAINVLYNTGYSITIRMSKDGSLRGEMRFEFQKTDLGAGADNFNVSPPCVSFINRIEDGSPEDVAAMAGVGTLPADSIRWDIVTPTGEDGFCVTSPIHFIADIDTVELISNEPGVWATSVLADANTVNPIYGYIYFFLAMISNRPS